MATSVVSFESYNVNKYHECSVKPVILSGGSGTRLWPISRRAYPKQFIPLIGEQSLFQQTVGRLSDPIFCSPMILGNSEHRFIIAEQVGAQGAAPSSIVLEPAARNTAPAALIAALSIFEYTPDLPILLLPSDHAIEDNSGFRKSIELGIPSALNGDIVTFGVTPTGPETGYGYIETQNGKDVLDVKRFVEKPTREKAQSYIDSGQFYWNAGIFMFTAKTMIEACRVHVPEMLKACQEALSKGKKDLDFLRLDKEAYEVCENVSIDYAIMEKADNIRCVPLQTGWSDLGSWPAVWQASPKDEQGNAIKGDVLLQDSTNCYAHSQSGACLVLVGLDGVSAIATKDAILVTRNDIAEGVKQIVEQLRRDGRENAVNQTRVYRPWGWYERLEMSGRFQVKCLMVKPGEKLSLQSHHHRAEHWVVVSGTARVTVDDNVSLLTENQSTYIPLGAVHRLENPGQIPALLIEVQSGSYLGEDDIVRYEDIYDRLENN